MTLDIMRNFISTRGTYTHLSVEIEQVKTEQTHPDLDVLDFDVLAFPLTEFLEGLQLTRLSINSNGLSIQDE